jgi:hypothetical protein
VQEVKMGDSDIIRFVVARRISTACSATEEGFERWFEERFPHGEALPKTDTGDIWNVPSLPDCIPIVFDVPAEHGHLDERLVSGIERWPSSRRRSSLGQAGK